MTNLLRIVSGFCNSQFYACDPCDGTSELGISRIRVAFHWSRPFKIGFIWNIKHDLMNRFGEHNIHPLLAILTILVFLFSLPLGVVNLSTSSVIFAISSNSYGIIAFRSGILIHLG